MRAALVLLVASFLGSCTQPPSARITVRRLEGASPPPALVRCLVVGLKARVQYQWKLGPGVRSIGWRAPVDEPAQLLDVGGVASPWVECDAADADGHTVKATAALMPPQISDSPRQLRARGVDDLVTVRGSGFPPAPGPDDGLYLVSERGTVVATDASCKGASWSQTVVSACVPPSLPAGAWQLRVQAGDGLALATAPLVVARDR
jgi:hypothetical protein